MPREYWNLLVSYLNREPTHLGETNFRASVKVLTSIKRNNNFINYQTWFAKIASVVTSINNSISFFFSFLLGRSIVDMGI